jgi:hypothetical protein
MESINKTKMFLWKDSKTNKTLHITEKENSQTINIKSERGDDTINTKRKKDYRRTLQKQA